MNPRAPRRDCDITHESRPRRFACAISRWARGGLGAGRRWLGCAALLPALAAACSGKSSSDDSRASAARGGNATGSAASAGAQALQGGTSGAGGEAAQAGEGGTPSAGGSSASGSGGSSRGGSGAGRTGGGGTTAGTAGSGTGGFGMTSGSAGSAGQPGWTCWEGYYDDGICHCGCGIQDRDCESDDDIDECAECNGLGSCTTQACPGLIDADDTSTCLSLPEAWACHANFYGDGQCDCGCEALDRDCADSSVESCERCERGPCSAQQCPSTIDEDDNAHCDIPEGWTCDPSDYQNRHTCDCGCGVLDPDCESSDSSVCDFGHCSGAIDVRNNALCLDVAGYWTCNPRFYGDGQLCNCGCGLPDPDCAGAGIDACDNCNLEGSCTVHACPSVIDPNDPWTCVRPPVPDGWTCDAARYFDSYQQCDCGCGVVDLDCESSEQAACESCEPAAGSCSERGCAAIDPANNGSCTAD